VTKPNAKIRGLVPPLKKRRYAKKKESPRALPPVIHHRRVEGNIAAVMRRLALRQLREGIPIDEIEDGLVRLGLPRDQAQSIVVRQFAHENRVSTTTATETLPMGNAVLGGIFAAVVGGCLIGWMVRISGSESGLANGLMGIVVSLGALAGGLNRGCFILQVHCFFLTLFGILVSKYWCMYFLFGQYLDRGLVPFPKSEINSFGHLQAFPYFVANLDSILGINDFIFIGIACISAWFLSGGVLDSWATAFLTPATNESEEREN